MEGVSAANPGKRLSGESPGRTKAVSVDWIPLPPRSL
jgi:hypothetical protein